MLSLDGPPTYAERLVAVALAEYVNDTSPRAFPSERTLETETALDRRKVHAAIDSLIAGGWLAAYGRVGRGRYGSHLREFELRFPDQFNGATCAPLDKTVNGAETAPLIAASMAQIEPLNGAKVDFNGATIAPDLEIQKETRGRGARARESASLTGKRKQDALDLAHGCDPATEWEKFTDWHRANGKTPADLDAAWRNWLRKCPTFNRTNIGKTNATSSGDESPDERERQKLLTLGKDLRIPRQPNETDDAYSSRVKLLNDLRLVEHDKRHGLQ